MATLRETIQAQINTAQAQVDSLKAQLNSNDKGVQQLLLADMSTLTTFFQMFKSTFDTTTQ